MKHSKGISLKIVLLSVLAGNLVIGARAECLAPSSQIHTAADSLSPTLQQVTAPFLSQDFTQTDANQCADSALDTMTQKFWNPKESQFNLAYNSSKCDGHADYWLSAVALDSMVDSYARTGRADIRQKMEKFFTFRKKKGWLEKAPTKFFDDEAWMALALIHATEVTGNKHYLDAAKKIFADIKGGWDETCCGDKPGGIWWSIGHKEKSTVSNAVAALVATKIGLLDHNKTEIAYGKKIYDYWYSQTVTTPFNNPNFLQTDDHIAADGKHQSNGLTYNDGMMAGAAIEIFKGTHDPKYFNDAKKFTNFILDQRTTPTQFGPVLSDHAPTDIPDCHPKESNNHHDPALPRHKDTPLFKYVTYRSMISMSHLLPEGEKEPLNKFLKANAAAACKLARDPHTGLFSANWEDHPNGITQSLISPMTAAVGMTSLFAGSLVKKPIPEVAAPIAPNPEVISPDPDDSPTGTN